MTNTLMSPRTHAVKQQVSASDRGHEVALGLMTINVLALPRFLKSQVVCFVGGVGTVKSYQPDSNTWSYAIEMDMGPEPDFGRVGSETTILLLEADVQSVIN